MKRQRLFGVAGAVVAALLASSCIRFAPATIHQASSQTEARTLAVALADVTGDGHADPIVLTTEGVVRFEPCGGGCLIRRETIAITGRQTLETGDFNGDLIQDVVIGGPLGGLPGTPVTPRIYFGGAASPSRPEGLVSADHLDVDAIAEFVQLAPAGVGDFNGDGLADILFRDDGHAIYRLGGGDGTFTEGDILYRWQDQELGIREAVVGDLDGNGDDEVVLDLFHPFASRTAVRVELAENEVQVNNTDLVVTGIGDLDGDGRDDLIAGARRLTFHRFNGSWFTPFPTDLAPDIGTSTARAALADVNNDGRMDLVGISSSAKQLSWWNGDGNGSFLEPFGLERLHIDLDAAPTALATGDVDGDGLDDLLLANGFDPSASVTLVMNDSVEVPPA